MVHRVSYQIISIKQKWKKHILSKGGRGVVLATSTLQKHSRISVRRFLRVSFEESGNSASDPWFLLSLHIVCTRGCTSMPWERK